MSKYTARTLQEIQQTMLNNMSDAYIKNVGTFTYDLNKSYALLSVEHEQEIEKLWNYFNIHSLAEEELEERVFQLQGLKRKQATYAIGEITVTGNGIIKEGDLFETPNAVRFKAIETKQINNSGTVKIEAVKAGTAGNVGAGYITLMPITLDGIKSIINDKATYDGFDAETDESLLERYDIAVQTPATSGNIYHYKIWASEVEGIGNAKIFPLWNGKNTVKIVVIDANYQPASSDLVEKAQNYIDPKGDDNLTWGCGYGEAPIGAYCTVSSAKGKEISINVTLKKSDTVELENLKKSIKNNIISFLKSIAFKKDYVSYSLIADTILNTDGVIEWNDLTINGETKSITLEAEEVAILKEVVVNE